MVIITLVSNTRRQVLSFFVGLLLFLGIGAQTAGPLLSTTTEVTTGHAEWLNSQNSQNCSLAKCNHV